MVCYAYHPSLICFQSVVVLIQRQFQTVLFVFHLFAKKKIAIEILPYSTCSTFRSGEVNPVPRVSFRPSFHRQILGTRLRKGREANTS